MSIESIGSKSQEVLTPQEAHNLILFLDRVQIQGIKEAQVLLSVSSKLARIRGPIEKLPKPPKSSG